MNCFSVQAESFPQYILLELMEKEMKLAKESAGLLDEVETPKWMTPVLLFIDLHEKVILGMNRRAELAEVRAGQLIEQLSYR